MTKLKVCAGLVLTLGVLTASVATVAQSQTAAQRVPSVERDLDAPKKVQGKSAVPRKANPAATSPQTRVTVQRADPIEFANPIGWSWLMRPRELQAGVKWGQASKDRILSGYSHVDPTDGSLRVYFVEVGRSDDLGPHDHRLVVLDALKNRYLPMLVDHRGGFGNGQGATKTNLMHAVYRLDRSELDPSKATHIGVEQIVRKQTKP